MFVYKLRRKADGLFQGVGNYAWSKLGRIRMAHHLKNAITCLGLHYSERLDQYEVIEYELKETRVIPAEQFMNK